MRAVFLDPELFVLPATLRRAFTTIRREVEALPADAWIRWPNEADVVGDVRVVPLQLTYRPPLLLPPAALEGPARRVCATTWSLFGDATVTLVFSRMTAGSHIRAHRDLDGPDHLRCHLGVRVAAGAWLRIDGERREWREGECLVFDPRRVHEVGNDSDADRTILIVDFLPSAAERAALTARGLPLPLT